MNLYKILINWIVLATTFSVGVMGFYLANCFLERFVYAAEYVEIHSDSDQAIQKAKVNNFTSGELDGFYHFHSNSPVAIDDFLWMQIETEDYNSLSDDSLYSSWNNFIKTDEKTFWFQSLQLEDGMLSFSTVEIEGTKYEFIGKYVLLHVSEAPQEERKILLGVLTTYKNGFRSRKDNVEFNWHKHL